LESFKQNEISNLTQLHLITHMQLTWSFLHDIIAQKGFIIALSSHSGNVLSRCGGLYAATKTGLFHFLKGLFKISVNKN